jgi:hypothetical protein
LHLAGAEILGAMVKDFLFTQQLQHVDSVVTTQVFGIDIEYVLSMLANLHFWQC